MNYNWAKIAAWFIPTLSLMLIIWLFIVRMLFPEIGVDGGYYLAIARDVFQDSIPFYKMQVPYNPLSIYIIGLPTYFQNLNGPIFSIIIVFLCQLINSILFYLLLLKFDISKLSSRIASFLFLDFLLLLDGYSIILEPVQMIFLLSSVLLFLNQKFFITGLVFFLAFYSKQYSLALAFGFGLSIIYKSDIKSSLKQIALIFSGFIIGVMMVFLISYKNIDFSHYIIRLLGLSWEQGKPTGPNYGIIDFINVLKRLIITFPLVFLVIFTLWKIKITKKTILLIGNLIGFSLIFLLAAYHHYVALVLPWSFIISFIYFDQQIRNPLITKLWNQFLVLSAILCFFYVHFIQNITQKYYTINTQLAKEFNTIIPKGSKVFLYSYPQTIYYLADYRSANNEKIGYTFPENASVDYFAKYSESASYGIIKKDLYIKNSKAFVDYLIVTQNNETIFLRKK